MISVSKILKLLRFYATKQDNGVINYINFYDYLRRYAQHHPDEKADLPDFTGGNNDPLQQAIDTLVQNRQIFALSGGNTKSQLIVLQFYVDKMTERYKEIQAAPELPFPTLMDLPKGSPEDMYIKLSINNALADFLNSKTMQERSLYALVLTQEMPALIFPSTVSVETFLETAFRKMQTILGKDEFHDYFLKKMQISNAGKEITAKNFFESFVNNAIAIMVDLKVTGDSYYFFNQLCFLIKKDFEKVKDYTAEDASLLYAVAIGEIVANFYKTSAQQQQKRDNALSILDSLLQKPPYYFSMKSIQDFKDVTGMHLLGQYTEKELDEHLHSLMNDTDGDKLPTLLSFKTASGGKYFVLKGRVVQLVLRLCADARNVIRETLIKEWSQALRNFEKLPEMNDQNAFETYLELQISHNTPMLDSLLASPFLKTINYEDQATDGPKLTLFVENKLLPYSELLSLNRQELYTDARIFIPFWYTAPIISFFAALLFKKPKESIEDKEKLHQDLEAGEARIASAEEELAKKNPLLQKKLGLRNSAKDLASKYVAEGSTLDRELEAYCHLWNKKLGPSRDNLTADTNALIKDSLRKVLRTLSADGFTDERVKNIAERMVATPTLQKITKDHDALEMYIRLYLIKLIEHVQ